MPKGSLFREDKKRRRSRRRHSRRSSRQRGLRRALLFTGLGVLGLLLVVHRFTPAPESLSGEVSDFGPSSSEPSRIRLPADDAPHNEFMEWWYYNGHLQGEGGKRYSFHATAFLVDTLVAHTVFHASLTDPQTGRHYIAQRRTPGNPSAGQERRFRFAVDGWLMEGSGGDDRIEVQAEDFRLGLSLSEGAPPIVHGQTGFLELGRAGSTYYYSRPRMEASGRLTVEGREHSVTGSVWFDHQWGDFRTEVLGWDWFALQLEGGVNVMLYELRVEGQATRYLGTVVEGGESEALGEGDFETRALGSWTSEATGGTYPMGWRVRIPEQGMDLEVRPVIRDSEFDARTTTHNAYWEGAVRVEGSHSGVGFVELSGYAASGDAAR